MSKHVFQKGELVVINNVRNDKADGIQSVFSSKLGIEQLDPNCKTKYLTIGDWDHRFPKEKGKRGVANCGACVRCSISNYDFTNTDGIVLSISSHGIEQDGEVMIQFLDGYLLPTSEIFHVLSDNECPTLHGKPRILILQALHTGHSDHRGQEIHVGLSNPIEQYPVQASSSVDERTDDDMFHSPPVVSSYPQRTRFPPISIPAGFLVIYPTTSGKYSYRDTYAGSWLEEELKKAVDEHDFSRQPELDFLKLLTRVTQRIASRETDTQPGVKNAMCTVNRLTKSIIFTARQHQNKMYRDTN